MDDQELIELLRKLEPGKASASMDGRVLERAERSALFLARHGRRRRVGRLLASAAAILLFSGLVILAPEEKGAFSGQGTDALAEAASESRAPDTRVSDSRVSDSRAPDARPPDREEALYMKARLLELKLSRLKEMAALSTRGSRYRADLHGLEQELKTMDPRFTEPLFMDPQKGDKEEENNISPEQSPEMKDKGVNHDEESRTPVFPSFLHDVPGRGRPGKTA